MALQAFLKLQEKSVSVNLMRKRLVVACTALQLLEKEEGNYRNGPDVERFLVKDKVTSIAPWLLFGGMDFQQWKNVADILQSDSPPKVLGVYEHLDDKIPRIYHAPPIRWEGVRQWFLQTNLFDTASRSLILNGRIALCAF